MIEILVGVTFLVLILVLFVPEKTRKEKRSGIVIDKRYDSAGYNRYEKWIIVVDSEGDIFNSECSVKDFYRLNKGDSVEIQVNIGVYSKVTIKSTII